MLKKIKYRLKVFIVLRVFLNTWIYYFIYKSYWHSLFFSKKKINKSKKNFLSTKVNYGARIGHQLANYNSALFYSKKFNLAHVHTPFPDKKWEKTLDINSDSVASNKLIEIGYKKVQLPRFEENNTNQISKIKKIIKSYSDEKVIFFLEIDQGYAAQYEVAHILQKKFFLSPQRKKDKLIYKKNFFNIAVHIRAGDILNSKKTLEQRNLNIEYFIKAINKSLSIISTKKQKKIYIFSEYYMKSFSKLKKFNNVKFCCNLNQYITFLHFIYADLLITSKSSFSYKAGLINKGIKLSPKRFWHKYPKNKKNWILLDN